MFKQLLITEIDASKTFLTLWLLAVTVLLLFMGYSGSELGQFIAASTVIFWIMLIGCAIVSGEEKRLRLYAQLPVTAGMVFAATWIMVICWIAALVAAWTMYGLLFDPTSDISAEEMGSQAIGLPLLLVLITIGFDLHAFRPAFIQWLYLGTLAGLLAVAIHRDLPLAELQQAGGIHIYPLPLPGGVAQTTALSVPLLLGLLAVNYYIYVRSDHYIR